MARRLDAVDAVEEFAQHRSKRIHLDEERVVPANAVELDKLRVHAHFGEPRGEFSLLRDREQDIRLHTDNQRALELQAPETGL